MPAPALGGLLAAAWEADQITGLNDGDPVATWPDASGNGRNLTQAVAANRPTFRINLLNGRPGVRFDGVNDLMASAAFPSAAETVIALFKQTAAGAANQLLYRHSDEVNSTFQLRFIQATDQMVWALFKSAILSERVLAAGGALFRDGRFHVDAHYTGLGTQATHDARRHGQPYPLADGTVGAPGVASFSGAFNVGNNPGTTEAWNGDVIAVLVYAASLTNAQLSIVLEYLQTKYTVVNATTRMVLVAAAQQGFADPTGPGAGFTVTKPAGTAAGDLMTATMNLSMADNQVETIGPPTGWTQEGALQNGIRTLTMVWSKLAGAGEPASYSWTISPPTSRGGSLQIRTWRGNRQTPPLVVCQLLQLRGTPASPTTVWDYTPGCVPPLGLLHLFGENDGHVSAPQWTLPVEFLNGPGGGNSNDMEASRGGGEGDDPLLAITLNVANAGVVGSLGLLAADSPFHLSSNLRRLRMGLMMGGRRVKRA